MGEMPTLNTPIDPRWPRPYEKIAAEKSKAAGFPTGGPEISGIILYKWAAFDRRTGWKDLWNK
jgi:hypothetical protein